MIKILHVITDTNIGGAGRMLIQYLKRFDREKFDITVAAPSGSAMIPLIKEIGYPVLETEHGHDMSHEKGGVSEYKRIIRELHPDIVHTHSSFDARVAAFLTGVKSRIYTHHCAFEKPKRLTTFPGKQINGMINNTLATRAIAVADAAADILVGTGVNPKIIDVIVNGVEPVRELSDEEKKEFRRSVGIGENDFVCLISARLEEYKGHSYLLETAREVKAAANRSVKFVIMGDGSARDELEKNAEKLGVEDIVIFTGFVYDVAPYCNIMDLNLNCSWGSEATSTALAEGMSLSKPIVATRCGGNTYMVEDGVNGFCVPMKDPRAMTEAILKILDDPSLYEKLGNGAADTYRRKFTAAAMTKRLEDVYEDEYRRISGKKR